jgi:hypothetical protein
LPHPVIRTHLPPTQLGRRCASHHHRRSFQGWCWWHRWLPGFPALESAAACLSPPATWVLSLEAAGQKLRLSKASLPVFAGVGGWVHLSGSTPWLDRKICRAQGSSQPHLPLLCFSPPLPPLFPSPSSSHPTSSQSTASRPSRRGQKGSSGSFSACPADVLSRLL